MARMSTLRALGRRVLVPAAGVAAAALAMDACQTDGLARCEAQPSALPPAVAQPTTAAARSPPPPPPPSALRDAALERALPERAHRQQIFFEYIESMRRVLANAVQRNDPRQIANLQTEIIDKQEAILFDALPGERRRYLMRYGCAAWTEDALAVCASHTPLVEIGAGAGQWFRALKTWGDKAGGEPAAESAHGGSKGGARHDKVETPLPPKRATSVDVVAYDDGSEVGDTLTPC